MQQDHHSATNAADLGRGLDSLLEGQLAHIRRRFLIHGIGWILAASALVIGTYYLLDRTLGLPAPIRIALTLASAAVLVVALRRRVLYPLTRAFGRDDVALALERRFPDLRQRLISAVQLNDSLQREGELRNQSAGMIEQLIAETAQEARQLNLRDLLDTGRTARLWGLSATLAGILLITFIANPTASGIFLERLFGFSTDYPHLTALHIELPETGYEYMIERSDGRAVTIRLAAGADLPVLVRAEGVIPREVQLGVSGGRGMPPAIAMTARGAGRFRHVFRRVHDSFTFHAMGGDDPRGDLDVEVITIEPPRVSTILTRISYPKYTQKEPSQSTGGNVQALVGSTVEITVTATAAVKQTSISFLDSGKTVELTPFELEDDSGRTRAYRGEFVISESDRYQVKLTSPDGLGNPHPGTYPVTAIKDHSPVGRVLIPSNDDIAMLLPNAVIPVRIEAGDDYGLTAIKLITKTGRDAFTKTHTLFDQKPDPENPLPTDSVFTALIEVSELSKASSATAPAAGSSQGEGDPIKTGDGVQLAITLSDNREPQSQSTSLAETRLHIVSQADLARRIASHYRRIRESVEKAIALQEDRAARLIEVNEALSQGEKLSQLRPVLLSVEVGQGRILTTSRQIHREFMRSFNVHLFNRLETSIHAPRVMELYSQYHQEHSDREALLPGFYRSLSEEQRAGRLGAMENTLDPILRMIERGDKIAVQLAPDAVRTVEAAGAASDLATLKTLMPKVKELQDAILVQLLALRERLDEWNEFQDVIFSARAIRDRQKDVKSRTKGTQLPGKSR